MLSQAEKDRKTAEKDKQIEDKVLNDEYLVREEFDEKTTMITRARLWRMIIENKNVTK